MTSSAALFAITMRKASCKRQVVCSLAPIILATWEQGGCKEHVLWRKDEWLLRISLPLATSVHLERKLKHLSLHGFFPGNHFIVVAPKKKSHLFCTICATSHEGGYVAFFKCSNNMAGLGKEKVPQIKR